MDVKLQIDAAQLNGTVTEIFSNLTSEQKQALAAEILKGYFSPDQPVCVGAKEKEAHYKRTGRWPDEGWSYNENVKRLMAEPIPFRDVIGALIANEILDLLRAEVAKQIQEDPGIKAIRDSVAETLKAEYPKMVHDAMMAFFCGHMQRLGEGVMQATMQLDNTNQTLQNLRQRLGNG